MIEECKVSLFSYDSFSLGKLVNKRFGDLKDGGIDTKFEANL